MIILAFFIVIAYSILFYLSRKELVEVDTKSFPLQKYFLRIIYFIERKDKGRIAKQIRKIKKKDTYFVSEQTEMDLHTLHPTKSIKTIVREYCNSKYSLALFMILAGSILIIFLYFLNQMNPILQKDMTINRCEQGNGDQLVTLEAQIGEKIKEQISFTVQEQKYTEAELEELSQKLMEEIEDIILAKNDQADYVTKDLFFPERITTYPFYLTYSLDSYDFLHANGTLIRNPEEEGNMDYNTWTNHLEKGVLVNITIKMEYDEFRKEYTFPIVIFEEEKTFEQKTIESLQRLLTITDQKMKTDKKFVLPKSINNHLITWKVPKSHIERNFFLLVIFVIIIISFIKDREVHELVQKREEQLLIDYPEVICKIMLLTGAGMTVRNAFYKIARDYKEKRENGLEKHYAYEEILLTVYEMESGIAEVEAYENFGKRCKLQYYVKLAAVLSQNTRKSASGLIAILQEEAKDSFELRKDMARKLGEEAGTKMLLPMIIMLLIVMIIIFYPAMSSFAS